MHLNLSALVQLTNTLRMFTMRLFGSCLASQICRQGALHEQLAYVCHEAGWLLFSFTDMPKRHITSPELTSCGLPALWPMLMPWTVSRLIQHWMVLCNVSFCITNSLHAWFSQCMVWQADLPPQRPTAATVYYSALDWLMLLAALYQWFWAVFGCRASSYEA